MRQALLLAAGITLATVRVISADGARSPVPEHPQAFPGVLVVLRDLSPPSQRVRFDAARAVVFREDGSSVEIEVVPRPCRGRIGDPVARGVPSRGELLRDQVSPFGCTLGSRSGREGGASTQANAGGAAVRRQREREHRAGRGPAVVDRAGLVRPFRAGPGRGRVRPRPTPALLGLASIGAWNGVALFDKRSGGPPRSSRSAAARRGWRSTANDCAPTSRSPGGSRRGAGSPQGRVRRQVPLRAGDAPRDVALRPAGGRSSSRTPGPTPSASWIRCRRSRSSGSRWWERPASLLMDRDGRRVFVLAERSRRDRRPLRRLALRGRGDRRRPAARCAPGSRAGTAERILVAQADSPY
jgi:hypothetical protein